MGGVVMNENIDLTTILKGCPKGTEFYSSLYGKVTFLGIRNDKYFPIEMMYYPNSGRLEEVYFTKDGRGWYNCNGECILFPSKEQRDWSKFIRFWDDSKIERFDPKTFQPFDKILVRDYLDELWGIELFSHKTGNIVHGLLSGWCSAIPFNENTKYLLNTREDCPEFFKWWKE